jgi:hypothetical protein
MAFISKRSSDVDGSMFYITGAGTVRNWLGGTDTELFDDGVGGVLGGISLLKNRVTVVSSTQFRIFASDIPDSLDEDPDNIPDNIFIYGVAEYKGLFTPLTSSPIQSKVEISKDAPIVVYGGNDYIHPSGLFQYNYASIVLGEGTASGLFRYIYLIVRNPNFNLPIKDNRVFDLVTDSGVARGVLLCQNTTESGNGSLNLIDTSYILNGRGRYTESGLVYSGQAVQENYPFEYIDISKWYTFSGVVTHTETTNYQDSPYFFVSLSGYNFFQKDSHLSYEAETAFVQRVTNIPQSEVTVIRCDNLL